MSAFRVDASKSIGVELPEVELVSLSRQHTMQRPFQICVRIAFEYNTFLWAFATKNLN